MDKELERLYSATAGELCFGDRSVLRCLRLAPFPDDPFRRVEGAVREEASVNAFAQQGPAGARIIIHRGCFTTLNSLFLTGINAFADSSAYKPFGVDLRRNRRIATLNSSSR